MAEIIYAVFEDRNEIKEIHMRMAECRNENLELRNFIPPQMYEWYKAISGICQEMREQHKDMKTQLHFGARDVDFFTKERGSDKAYKKIALEDVTDVTKLPKFDHGIKWRKRIERPPRRKVEYNMSSVMRPSLRKTHQLSRSSSHDNMTNGIKRHRGNSSKQVETEENSAGAVQSAGSIEQMTIQ